MAYFKAFTIIIGIGLELPKMVHFNDYFLQKFVELLRSFHVCLTITRRVTRIIETSIEVILFVLILVISHVNYIT